MQQVLQVQRVLKESKEYKVLKEFKELQDPLEQLVQRVLTVRQVLLVRQALRVLQVQQDRLDLLALQFYGTLLELTELARLTQLETWQLTTDKLGIELIQMAATLEIPLLKERSGH